MTSQLFLYWWALTVMSLTESWVNATPTHAAVAGFCMVACKRGLLLHEWTLPMQLILLHAM